MDTASTTVDLTPLLQAAITIGVALLSAFGAWAIRRLGDRLGLEADDKRRDYLNEALENGLAYAAKKVAVAGADLARIEVRNRVVAEAIAYVQPKIPEALKRLKLTPADLKQMLEARLAGAPAGVGPQP